MWRSSCSCTERMIYSLCRLQCRPEEYVDKACCGHDEEEYEEGLHVQRDRLADIKYLLTHPVGCQYKVDRADNGEGHGGISGLGRLIYFINSCVHHVARSVKQDKIAPG